MAVGVAEPVEANGKVRVPTLLVYVVIAVGGWIVSGYVGYTTAMNATNSRLAVVETKAEDVGKRIDELRGELAEIRADVKTLLRRQQ